MSAVDMPVEKLKAWVREEWTCDTMVTAWDKWYPQMVVQWQSTTDVLLDIARIEPGMQVLEVAGGVGASAADLSRVVGAAGHITETDLSAGLLAASQKNARQAGLSNISFEEADAHMLRFADQSFDRVVSRFGVMFFADGVSALKEIHRVLKPAGRAAFIAWGAIPRNPYFTTMMSPFMKRGAIQPPPPGAPTPFKYVQEGSLAEDLRRAGFQDVREETRTVDFSWPGTPEELAQNLYDIAGGIRSMIDALPASERQQAFGEMTSGFRQLFDGQQVKLPAHIIAATGDR